MARVVSFQARPAVSAPASSSGPELYLSVDARLRLLSVSSLHRCAEVRELD